MKYNIVNDKNYNFENQYVLLANAIIIQAVKDYRRYIKAQLKSPNDLAIRGQINLLEKFFKSQWCSELSDLNIDYLLTEVRREVIKEFKEKKMKAKKDKGEVLC